MRSRKTDQKPCGVCRDAAAFTVGVIRALSPDWCDESEPAAGQLRARRADGARLQFEPVHNVAPFARLVTVSLTVLDSEGGAVQVGQTLDIPTDVDPAAAAQAATFMLMQPQPAIQDASAAATEDRNLALRAKIRKLRTLWNSIGVEQPRETDDDRTGVFNVIGAFGSALTAVQTDGTVNITVHGLDYERAVGVIHALGAQGANVA